MRTPLWHDQKSEVGEGRELYPLGVPILSLQERDRRWAVVREKMYFRGLQCLVVVGTDFNSSMGMANVRYLTQVGSIVGAYAVFPAVGDPVVFTGAPHMHMPTSAYRHIPGSWIDDVRPKAGVGGIVALLEERGLDHGRIGVVGYSDLLSPVSNLSAGFLEELRRSLPAAVISDETPLVDEARVIKSEEEKEFLRVAGSIARKRVERLIATAKPGVSEAEVWAAMEHEAVINGAEPITFNFLSSGPVTGADANGRVQNLIHGSEIPATPTQRALQEGDVLVCEFHTSYGGYLAATEFSIFLGEAPAQLVRLHEAAADIVRMAKDLMRPGYPLRHAYSAFHRHIEEAGFDFVELGFHGHGLASPEFPAVVYREADHVHIGRPGIGDMLFRESMVFGLNIDIHDPSWRRDVGMMLGDMVILGADETEYACNIPLDVFELR
jgi:Xaa-Pro aminopeptidase